MKNIIQIVKDIKSIKIQGATNIAKASIGALLDFEKSFIGNNCILFLKEMEKNAQQLAWARPNEPLNQNLINLIIFAFRQDKNKDSTKRIENFRILCRQALELIEKNEQSITANGIKLIGTIYHKKKKPVNIFTHCNSSSVFKIIFGAHLAGLPVKVYNSETRPLFQGRIMAKNLVENGIDVTMMTDSAAPFVISKNNPDRIDIDLALIGADVIGLDGSVLNKIGSYSLALAAKNADVPFYVATSLLKIRKDINSYKQIDIEKRDPTELWQQSLKGIKIINYAFDTVPPACITGLITEFGVLKAKDVKKTAKNNYKDILKK